MFVCELWSLRMRKFCQGAFGGATSLKLVVAGMAAVLLAGCSDSVDRFAESYNNPSDRDPVYTASIKKPKLRAPSAAYQAPQLPETDTIVQSPVVQSPVAHAAIAKSAGADYADSYAKTYRQAPAVAAAQLPTAPKYKQPKLAYNAPAETAPAYKAPSLEDKAQPADSEKSPAIKPFKKKRGPKITVAEGMSLYDIAKANKMTVKQLADANGLQAPYTVAPGTELVVPGVKVAVLPKVAVAKLAAPAAEDTAQVDALISGKQHVVAKGDTLFTLGRKYNVSAFAIADANGLPHNKSLALGRKIKIPVKANDNVALAPAKENGKADFADKSAKSGKSVEKVDVAEAKTPAEPAAPTKSAAAPSDAQLALRWPVRGRVISAYGSKPNGMKNEGINIMAPEGTSIQAADAGVVAYAGNELKGYGNLVLIRHAGGYVTAYAHASSLMVKKGDTVKRGDVVAKVGQTGSVQSPQLHFEVRKGATALDPASFLNAATASK